MTTLTIQPRSIHQTTKGFTSLIRTIIAAVAALQLPKVEPLCGVYMPIR